MYFKLRKIKNSEISFYKYLLLILPPQAIIFALAVVLLLLLREIIFSISTAKNTNDEAAPTKMNSFRVKASVLKMGCKNGV